MPMFFGFSAVESLKRGMSAGTWGGLTPAIDV